MSPNLSLFVGNIGSGKSIIANKLSLLENAVVCNMDTIQAMFSGGDYDRYDNEKKEVYHATEDAAIQTALSKGLSVVVDRTLMSAKRRQHFIEIGQKYGAKIVAYDWGPGEEECLKNRFKNPRGIPRDRWRSVYEFMQRSYEAPVQEEGFDEIIKPPERYRFHAFDFDGTIVAQDWPNIGEIIDGTVEKINELYQDLSNIIIIWTNRSGNFEYQMREFINKRKVMYDFINENPIWDPGSRKIFAHVYYDDRNALLEGADK